MYTTFVACETNDWNYVSLYEYVVIICIIRSLDNPLYINFGLKLKSFRFRNPTDLSDLMVLFGENQFIQVFALCSDFIYSLVFEIRMAQMLARRKYCFGNAYNRESYDE